MEANLDKSVLRHVCLKHAPVACCVLLRQHQNHLRNMCSELLLESLYLLTFREASMESAMFSMIDFPTCEEDEVFGGHTGSPKKIR